MICELAEYENASSSVLATKESLARTLTFAPSIGHTNPGYAKTLLLRLPRDPNSARKHNEGQR